MEYNIEYEPDTIFLIINKTDELMMNDELSSPRTNNYALYLAN